jgi:uncharacterized membrane protein
MMHRHPANQARHDDRDIGQRVADTVTGYFGSWRFIILQTVAVAVWIVLNLVAWIQHWDAYPFILLNLVFSTQAAYAAPLILLSQNRTSEHDRVKAEVDYQHNTESLDLLRKLCRGDIAIQVSQRAIAQEVAQIAEQLEEDTA